MEFIGRHNHIMTDLIKRNNYVDGQFIDVSDFKTEQSYFLEKIRDLTIHTAGNGSVDLKGLNVVTDTTMAEPISADSVAIAIEASPDITASNPQNFTAFPDSIDTGLEDFLAYTVFQAKTYNIQRTDLRITLNQALTNENLDLIIRVRQLVDGTNPLSPLANTPPLSEVQFAQSELPALDSSDYLVLDFSHENSGQGLATVKDLYYALEIQFRRPINSTSGIRLFHNPLNETSALDQDLLSFIYTNGKFAQTFVDANSFQQSLMFYHKVYTSAIKVLQGEAFINGQRALVEADQFNLLEIPDRRDVDQYGNLVFNYVVLTYVDVYTDPEQIKGTKNTADTRIKDSSKVQVLTQPQWESLLADQSSVNKYLLLAVVCDSNVVSLYSQQTFTVPTNSTNLAFHDWLNPNNITPSSEASLVQASRPEDFIFFVANVPSKVPLTDLYGNIQLEPVTVLDEFGNVLKKAGEPILDDVVRLTVNITLADGTNTRILELAQISEVGYSSMKFRNYSGTISNLTDNPFDNVFTFNYNADQIAPNVVYNFVAFTKRGLPIFIQDYNKVVATDKNSLVRSKEYEVFLDKSSRTVVVHEDLVLGAFNPATDQSQPGVVQFVPTFIKTETMIPVGSAITETINFNTQIEILETQSFLFDAPMAYVSGTKIKNLDSEVQTAYDAYDISILVDLDDGSGPVDITFSGTSNRDKGGNGVAVYISGAIDISVSLPTANTADVKARNFDGKDNTNYSSSYSPYGPPAVGGSSDVRSFNLLARGYDGLALPTNLAGFFDGEQVYIYIGDKQALDANYQPISFTFNSLTTSVLLPTIMHLGPQKYFREKEIKSIESSSTSTPGVVLVDTGLDALGNSKEFGQVIFNSSEIPTAIVTASKVYLKYNAVTTVPQNIDYYQTKYKPHGTKDGFKIANTNVVSSSTEYISVPEAIAMSSSTANYASLNSSTFTTVALFVDGINITSLLSPIGQKQIVADDGLTLLAGQVAYNPELGTFKFYKITDAYSNIISEAPTDYTRLSLTYYKLDTNYIFNTTTNATYEPKFDINNDGRIDELDLNTLNRAMGSFIGSPNYIVAADFNADGKIDSLDMDLFMPHFGAVALGQPDYVDATSARLNSLLVVKSQDYLKRFKVIRAVSKAADTTNPNGTTVLFLDDSTPVLESGLYKVTFGFSAAMYLGFIQAEIETTRPFIGNVNLANIEMFELENPTNTKKIVSLEASLIPNTSNRYNSLITFAPAVNLTSNYLIRTQWSDKGIIVKNTKDLIISQKYEQLDRKVYGPFKLDYKKDDYKTDGTSIRCTLKAIDATLADGSVDHTGTHIQGIPLSELYFTVHLTLPNSDGTTSIWTWHQVQPLGTDNKIVLEFNKNLFIDHQLKGKDGKEVLTPFGLGLDQVALMPQYAGGDLINDLANISVIRSDVVSPYVLPHKHSNDRDGGILTSKNIIFADDLARFNLSPDSDMTAAIYSLLDTIQEQERQLELLRAVTGIVRYDSGLRWDSPDLTWDS